MENFYPAFCLFQQFEWLNFFCFLFYIFSIMHIFQSGPANLWTENCCVELNSACPPQSRWDDMHNICVRNSSASKLEIPLMFADVCTCTLHCAVFQICAFCIVQCLQMCALCTVQCFRCVHLHCAATPVARCHKDTKGTTPTQPKMWKKPSQSQNECNMHCSACWSHLLISGFITPS